MTESVTLRFRPEAWKNDYAAEVDPRGETDFDVLRADVEYGDGELPDGHVGDRFKRHENAPEWVREWSGPFTITVV